MGCGSSVHASAPGGYAPLVVKEQLAGLPSGLCHTLKCLANDCQEKDVWSVCEALLRSSTLDQDFYAATLNHQDQIVKGLVSCVRACLEDSCKAAQDLVSSGGEGWSSWQRSVCKQLRETTTQARKEWEERLAKALPTVSLSEYEGGVGGVTRVIVKRILACLGALRRKPGSPPAEAFYCKPLNYTTRVILAAAWKGDALAGGKPGIAGIPGWIPNCVTECFQLCEVTEAACDESEAKDEVVVTGDYLLLMDGATKALLSYQDSIAAGARENGVVRKLHIRICRNQALHQSLGTLRDESGAAAGAGANGPTGSMLVVNPTFESANGTIEEGEGHGPRKEFFTIVSQRMCGSWGPEAVGPCTLSSVDEAEGAAKLQGINLQCIKKGDRLRFGSHEAQFAPTDDSEAVMVAGVSDDGVFVKLTHRLPKGAKLDNVMFTYSSPRQPFLTYKQGMEAFWPNSALDRSPESFEHFFYLGWLIGCCQLNRSHLGFRLPVIFFRQLLAESISDQASSGGDTGPLKDWSVFTAKVSDLRRLDPSLLEMAQKIVAMDDEGFKAVLEAEDLPAATSRDKYIKNVAKELVVDSVKWQMEALRAGFRRALGTKGLDMMRRWETNAQDLCTIVCGVDWGAKSDFDITKLFRIVMDGDVQDSPELTDALWQVVGSWEPAKKRRFLFFVTGVDKLPAPGSEDLLIELPFVTICKDDHLQAMNLLPQAHTCSNTLELPNYWESIEYLSATGDLSLKTDAARKEKLREVLAAKLTMAIENTSGYGLDELTARPPGTPSGRRPDSARRRAANSQW